MELAHIALENLSISPANMRHGKRDPDISDILPSVRTRGVLVPLLVRPNGTPQSFEIVAGRRRFFAAKAVAAEGGTAAPLPCGILAADDDANALEASLIENIHRLDPDEMSQYETFAKLIKTGKSPEDSYFRDAELFWTKQNEVIAARQEAYLVAGWGEVVILDQAEHFQTWEHEKRAKKKGGKVFIATSARGEVSFHEGYVTRKEARRKDKEAAKAEGKAVEMTHPEVSSGLQTYIDLHRHLGARAALLETPAVALRLMVAHAVGGSRLWSVQPEPQRSGRAATDASVQASPLQTVFAARKGEALAALGLPESCGLVAGHAESTAILFARLLALPDGDVMRILTVVMADSMEAGTELVETVGVHLNVDLRPSWQPDDAFFDLIRDKAVLTQMVTEIAGKAVAKGNIAATGKTKKQIMRDHLAGANGRAKTEGWLPGWLAFPVRSYRKRSGFRTAVAWKTIQKLFEK